MMTVLLLSTDLLFSSSLSGDAQRAGCQLHTADNTDQLLQKVATAAAPTIVLIDLGKTSDVAEAVRQLRACATPPRAILAYGPHVHRERLAAAREAGCDLVLTRGQLHSGATQLFANYVAQA